MDATTESLDPSAAQNAESEGDLGAPVETVGAAPVETVGAASVVALGAVSVGTVAAAPVAAPCPCQITFSGMVASEAPKVEVRAWLQRLGPLTASMTGGRVLIEAIDRDRKERQYQVRLEISLPGQLVVVGPEHPSNGPHEDVYVAIRNAFRGARRELELHRLPPNGPTDLQI